MSDKIRSVLFAVCVAVVCGLFLSGAASGLKEYQIRNIAVDRQKNILKSVGLVEEDRVYSTGEIESSYAKNIRRFDVGKDGKLITENDAVSGNLPIYLYVKNDAVQAYTIPINTRGLWGTIYGYLALEKDGSTITGFTVYKHSETPGLGGEIERAWFRKNFEGKQIVDATGNFVSISVAKGKVKDAVPEKKQQNFVDGISGATMTGKFLTQGFKDILSGYEPASVNFRKNTVRLPE